MKGVVILLTLLNVFAAYINLSFLFDGRHVSFLITEKDDVVMVTDEATAALIDGGGK